MINNIHDIIEFYNFVKNDQNIDSIILEINKISENRARFKMKILENNEILIKLRFLCNMNIKKTRKQLLSIDYKNIVEFNNILKERHKDKFIQNFNNKEYWIYNILSYIKKESEYRIKTIENIVGFYPDIEQTRLKEDDRIRNYIGSRFDDFSDHKIGPEWSEKMNCSCIKDINPDYYFKKNNLYSHRISNKNESITSVYYHRGLHLIFEENSFLEYFIDRNKRIDEILK